MSYMRWKPYVPVAKRRAEAEKAAVKARKAGKGYAPVTVVGRTIASTFWGKAWCDNLEAYSDYDNRLPRGRSYVRNGSVVDLNIEPGRVLAKVMGSRLYKVEIDVDSVSAQRWKALAKDSTGSIDSLVALLQGTFSKAMMQRLCEPSTGLFPSPKQIRFTCSCPDWATMCKHVAAVLYGVGARLDTQPELLFTLRKVDASELVRQAAEAPLNMGQRPTKARTIEDAALSELFGIELGQTTDVPAVAQKKPGSPAGKTASIKSTVAEKIPAKKAPPKKTSVKKIPAKKILAKKTPAKKIPAKKTVLKKTVPKKVSKTASSVRTVKSPSAATKKTDRTSVKTAKGTTRVKAAGRAKAVGKRL
jgi:uncharacterized Zn finger protein